MSAGWHTVHVRVNDASTGQPTPVRVRFTGPDGEYLAPFGRLTEFATGRNQAVGGNLLLGTKPWAYVDGSFEIRLPAGPIGVEIHKGPEYKPVQQTTQLPAGKIALRFTIERWTDLRAERWYSGDTRAHFLSPHAALLEAAAEGLAVVNLLAVECSVAGAFGRDYPAIPGILEFSGQAPALERPGHMVVVNSLNTHPVLGSLGLLNCHRTVFPLSFGGPSGKEDWTLADWCDQCHRKGGLVIWTKPGQQGAALALGEPLADLILGKIDAFEIDFFEDSIFDIVPDWYRLQNCGFHIPLVGGSGKDSNGIALGAMRTYARLLPDEPFTYRNWVESIRAGRTFVSNGPLMTITVDDHDSGSMVTMPEPGKSVRIRATAQSQLRFDRLEVLAGGVVIASTEPTGAPASATLELDWTPSSSTWLAARCVGASQVPHRPAYQRIFAHTSPVYLHASDRPMQVDAEALAYLRKDLERMLEWVAHDARCDTDRQREQLREVFQTAHNVLLQRTGN